MVIAIGQGWQLGKIIVSFTGAAVSVSFVACFHLSVCMFLLIDIRRGFRQYLPMSSVY